ncbi:MAG: hypothetical protein NNA23_12945 [Nitrospira sp.]|nr:hypothetical protein [Nitrospira sp.]
MRRQIRGFWGLVTSLMLCVIEGCVTHVPPHGLADDSDPFGPLTTPSKRDPCAAPLDMSNYIGRRLAPEQISEAREKALRGGDLESARRLREHYAAIGDHKRSAAWFKFLLHRGDPEARAEYERQLFEPTTEELAMMYTNDDRELEAIEARRFEEATALHEGRKVSSFWGLGATNMVAREIEQLVREFRDLLSPNIQTQIFREAILWRECGVDELATCRALAEPRGGIVDRDGPQRTVLLFWPRCGPGGTIRQWVDACLWPDIPPGASTNHPEGVMVVRLTSYESRPPLDEVWLLSKLIEMVTTNESGIGLCQ